MMKLRTLILGLIAFTFVASLFAGPPVTTHQYGKETLESLNGAGLIKLNGTTITNDLHFNGSLITKEAQIGSLDVMGEANLNQTTIHKASTIMGSLQATQSKFLQPITILSQKTLFTSCKLQGITVRKDDSYKGKQTIELKQGTIVDGPIHFESGKGEVILSSSSQVLGPITGGKVIKKP